MTTPRLGEGRWSPDLQMYNCGDQTSTQISFPGTVGVAKDALKNETQAPMILRALSTTYNWVETRKVTTSPLLYEVTLRASRGEYKLFPNGQAYAPAASYVCGLYGTLGVTRMPWTYKLAAPCRVEPGQVILIECGNVESDEVFIWTAATADKTTGYAIHCRGAVTGQQVVFGDSSATSSGSVSHDSYTHQNYYDEPLDILAVTLFTAALTTDRPIFSMEVGGRRWSKQERPFWLFAEPFRYSRIVFDRLPEGGVLLEPGDGIEVTIMNPQYADGGGYNNIYCVVGMESYVKVA